MSRINLIQCDGCDAKEHIDADLSKNMILVTTISIDGKSDQVFDLCSSCRTRLADNCNPKT